MKAKLRAVGIDDAPFVKGDTHTELIAVAMRAPQLIEGYTRCSVAVDGVDASDRVIDLVHQLRQSVQVILLDGICCGGFNPFDLQEIWDATAVPVISVAGHSPDLASMLEAVKTHFEDWRQRWQVINSEPIHQIQLETHPLWISVVGIQVFEAKTMLQLFSPVGHVPEPLRLAHLCAAGLFPSVKKNRAWALTIHQATAHAEFGPDELKFH